jgi:hypothetical protein
LTKQIICGYVVIIFNNYDFKKLLKIKKNYKFSIETNFGEMYPNPAYDSAIKDLENFGIDHSVKLTEDPTTFVEDPSHKEYQYSSYDIYTRSLRQIADHNDSIAKISKIRTYLTEYYDGIENGTGVIEIPNFSPFEGDLLNDNPLFGIEQCLEEGYAKNLKSIIDEARDNIFIIKLIKVLPNCRSLDSQQYLKNCINS